jgi:hypothetical protein
MTSQSTAANLMLPLPGTPGKGQGRGAPPRGHETRDFRRSMLRDVELFLEAALRSGARGWTCLTTAPASPLNAASVYSAFTTTPTNAEARPC